MVWHMILIPVFFSQMTADSKTWWHTGWFAKISMTFLCLIVGFNSKCPKLVQLIMEKYEITWNNNFRKFLVLPMTHWIIGLCFINDSKFSKIFLNKTFLAPTPWHQTILCMSDTCILCLWTPGTETWAGLCVPKNIQIDSWLILPFFHELIQMFNIYRVWPTWTSILGDSKWKWWDS